MGRAEAEPNNGAAPQKNPAGELKPSRRDEHTGKNLVKFFTQRTGKPFARLFALAGPTPGALKPKLRPLTPLGEELHALPFRPRLYNTPFELFRLPEAGNKKQAPCDITRLVTTDEVRQPAEFNGPLPTDKTLSLSLPELPPILFYP
jgi:hypothetical protein